MLHSKEHAQRRNVSSTEAMSHDTEKRTRYGQVYPLVEIGGNVSTRTMAEHTLRGRSITSISVEIFDAAFE